MNDSAIKNPIQRLISIFAKLPGIGEKTATRLAYYILKSPPEFIREFGEALVDVKERVSLCSICSNFSDKDPCIICRDPRRDKTTICVVEDPSDLAAIEKSGSYRGEYHVLHGVISPLDGISPEDLRIKELLARLSNGVVKEIIIATNPSAEGDATAMYIMQAVKPLGIKVTRIASGVPIGGDIEYTDQVTISRAIEARHEL
jgi:recombination protein RecR